MVDINQDVPKEIADKAYEAIEIARKSGKIKKGSNEVTKVIERGMAKLVVIAKDTNPLEVIMHIPALCEEKGVTCVVVPSREDLGAASGLNVPTSAVAIVKEGDSADLIKELSK